MGITSRSTVRVLVGLYHARTVFDLVEEHYFAGCLDESAWPVLRTDLALAVLVDVVLEVLAVSPASFLACAASAASFLC